MPIKIKMDKDGITIIRAQGKLTKEDYPLFTSQFEEAAGKNGNLRVFFDMTEFDGWDSEGIWEEAKFDFRHNSDIDRLAAVGDEKWHGTLVKVLSPFASAEVRFFHRDEVERARVWLLEPQRA